MQSKRCSTLLLFAALTLGMFMTLGTFMTLSPATAVAAEYQDVVQLWEQASAPPPPVLEDVTVDPATTALLILDIEELTCNEERRPRCLGTVGPIAALAARARDVGMLVAYSLTSRGTPETILAPVTPQPGETIVQASVNKFYGTELDDVLRAKGIKTVIVTGTAAHGAVLHTATGAGQRGYSVVLPVEGLSAETLYIEQASVWLLKTGPGTRKAISLTSTDRIAFEKGSEQ